MFSDVIYVDKNTLEKERYPELLLKIIAKGGNGRKKCSHQWMMLLLKIIRIVRMWNFLHPCLSRRMHPIKKSSFYHG